MAMSNTQFLDNLAERRLTSAGAPRALLDSYAGNQGSAEMDASARGYIKSCRLTRYRTKYVFRGEVGGLVFAVFAFFVNASLATILAAEAPTPEAPACDADDRSPETPRSTEASDAGAAALELRNLWQWRAPDRKKGRIVNTSRKHTVMVVADGKIYRLGPRRMTPDTVDADGVKGADGMPLGDHESWWKTPNGFVAIVLDKADGLVVQGLAVWRVERDEFGRLRSAKAKDWGVPLRRRQENSPDNGEDDSSSTATQEE
jgi:hypothetical protein